MLDWRTSVGGRVVRLGRPEPLTENQPKPLTNSPQLLREMSVYALCESKRNTLCAQRHEHFPWLNDQLMIILREECASRGIMHDVREIFSYLHQYRKEMHEQLSLFCTP